MKVTIDQSDNFVETEIIIRCNHLDEQLIQIISQIKVLDKKITGNRNGNVCVIEIEDIYYFESVDNKTFIYTKKDVYETNMKLYEVEEKFKWFPFFRSSKSVIVNLKK